jgi:hypothetical protein
MKNLIFLTTIVTSLFLFSALASAHPNFNVDINSNSTSVLPDEPVEFTVTVTNTGTDTMSDSTVKVYGLGRVVGDLRDMRSDTMWDSCNMIPGEDACFWHMRTLEAGKSKIIKIIASRNKIDGEGANVYAIWGNSTSHKLYLGCRRPRATIPEFDNIALPIVLSLVSFGIVLKARKKY